MVQVFLSYNLYFRFEKTKNDIFNEMLFTIWCDPVGDRTKWNLHAS